MHVRLWAAAAAVLLAAAPALAHTSLERPGPHIADIVVWDRTSGERLPVYWHDGQRWIAGSPGHRYAVSIRNRAAGRILAVLAVDGINAVSGETADWTQRGYVLSADESFDVLGWRKSTATVADFVFTALEDSYAARTGRPADAGVIGVAVFHEALRVAAAPVAEPASRDAAGGPASAAPPASAARLGAQTPAPDGALAAETAVATRQRLGTGHGPNESSSVVMVDFERQSERPDEILTIRYDRYDRLLALGVIAAAAVPQAFPGSPDTGFVPDPPARR